MPWTGEPETKVTRMTFTEWTFSIAARREVQIGYSVRVQDWWELFGNDHWLSFTGEIMSFRGAVQIVAQWPEVEPLGSRNRVWQWVHWRNLSADSVVVKPHFVLAPPISASLLSQSETTSARRRIWTLADVADDQVVAIGTDWSGTGSGGDTGGSGSGGGAGSGGAGGREGLAASVAVRPLAGQRVRRVALEGDLRYVPVDELWKHIDRLLERPVRPRPKRRSRR
jgi:hypothetical protein